MSLVVVALSGSPAIGATSVAVCKISGWAFDERGACRIGDMVAAAASEAAATATTAALLREHSTREPIEAAL